MKDGEVVVPDASSISGIAAVIQPTAGGEMVRVPGTRKPVNSPVPPPTRQVGTAASRLWSILRAKATGLAGRISAAASGDSAKQKNSGKQPVEEVKSPTGPVTPPGKRPVRCFDCGSLQFVSEVARSTQCSKCSVYISLEDYEITTGWSQNIHTRGDVIVTKTGAIIGCDIACHHLTVLGKVSASIDCSGNATFRGSSRILGSMHCRHLRVEKKCELNFPQGVIAESADIYGQVDGNILCSGTVRIFKSGRVLGDATARSIVLKDGGVLTGKMQIQPEVEIPLPPKRNRR